MIIHARTYGQPTILGCSELPNGLSGRVDIEHDPMTTSARAVKYKPLLVTPGRDYDGTFLG